MKSDPILKPLLDNAWEKYCEIFPALSNFIPPVIRFDGRLKTANACCYDFENRITVSRHWFSKQGETLFKTDIIPHEIAHQIVFNVFGPQSEDHCDKWRAIMISYGIEPREAY